MPNPCRNSGTCFVSGSDDTYVCLCDTGFTGVDCEIGKVPVDTLILIFTNIALIPVLSVNTIYHVFPKSVFFCLSTLNISCYFSTILFIFGILRDDHYIFLTTGVLYVACGSFILDLFIQFIF